MASVFTFDCAGCGRKLKAGDPDCTCPDPWASESSLEDRDPAHDDRFSPPTAAERLTGEAEAIGDLLEQFQYHSHDADAVIAKVELHLEQMTEALSALFEQAKAKLGSL